jgi:hypothetical protein
LGVRLLSRLAGPRADTNRPASMEPWTEVPLQTRRDDEHEELQLLEAGTCDRPWRGTANAAVSHSATTSELGSSTSRRPSPWANKEGCMRNKLWCHPIAAKSVWVWRIVHGHRCCRSNRGPHLRKRKLDPHSTSPTMRVNCSTLQDDAMMPNGCHRERPADTRRCYQAAMRADIRPVLARLCGIFGRVISNDTISPRSVLCLLSRLTRTVTHLTSNEPFPPCPCLSRLVGTAG